MIIGNNNNNNFNKTQPKFTSNFEERFNTVVEEGLKNQEKISPYKETTQTAFFKNINDKNEMAEKSFAMLQERLNNGLITIDEFKKKCEYLNKQRQK